MSLRTILTVSLRNEHDVVLARQRARQIASLFGFDQQDQTRITTAVSEIARNAQRYAREGQVAFSVDDAPPMSLVVRVADKGPGIRDLQKVLSGQYRSTTGMGIGLIGVHRLVDDVEIQTSPQSGTTVTLTRRLPRQPIDVAGHLESVAAQLASQQPRSLTEEIQSQNQELLKALDEQREAYEKLRERQEEVERLNKELEETNRGVMALYTELDDKAEQLRLASEQKTRFLSYMSHEFRTPLASIRSMARLLLDRMDGPLTEEQERQIRFIRSGAEDLTSLVDDLLDLAKIEAGRLRVSPEPIDVGDLLGALRGMFRPIASESAADLIFEPPDRSLSLFTDQQKLTQILRNLISNAVKFTPHGEIRVSVRNDGALQRVVFLVADTGIGISPDQQEAIFEEFSQIDSPLQRRAKGTGLGLALCRTLASLLGGKLDLRSDLGVGSTFTLSMPYRIPDEALQGDEAPPQNQEVHHA